MYYWISVTIKLQCNVYVYASIFSYIVFAIGFHAFKFKFQFIFAEKIILYLKCGGKVWNFNLGNYVFKIVHIDLPIIC